MGQQRRERRAKVTAGGQDDPKGQGSKVKVGKRTSGVYAGGGTEAKRHCSHLEGLDQDKQPKSQANTQEVVL